MSTVLEGPFDLHYPHLFDAIIQATSDDAVRFCDLFPEMYALVSITRSLITFSSSSASALPASQLGTLSASVRVELQPQLRLCARTTVFSYRLNHKQLGAHAFSMSSARRKGLTPPLV